MGARGNTGADSHTQEAHETRATGGETILVVDDDETTRDLLRLVLERLGYHVFTANDGTEAIDLVVERETAVDLVLTDVVMPKLGAEKLCPMLLQLLPGLRIILMSGAGADSDGAVAQAMAAGARDFLRKPVGMGELAASVRRVLDQKG